jgi:hypothetical protein
MFASFDLQEVIHYYIERHSAVIVTFLDSMKAFDTVSHNGLKVKPLSNDHNYFEVTFFERI